MKLYIYGPNIASYPVRFNIAEILANLSLQMYNISGMPSTSYSIINITLSLVDYLNQTVSTWNNQSIEMFLYETDNNQQIKISDNRNLKIEEGKINISNIYFFSNISKNKAILIINTSTIQLNQINYRTYSKNERIEDNEYQLIFPLTIISCLLGEVFDQKLLICILCNNNKFSLNSSDGFCQICPMEASYCYENIISLKNGYWRSGGNTTLIYECDREIESCLGGYLSECAEGYRGPLCNSCNVSDIIYSKSFDNSCVQCSTNTAAIIMKLIFGSLILIIFYIFIIYTNLEIIDTLKINENTGEINSESKEKFISPIYSKILMNYFQTVALIKGIDLKWGSLVNNFFQIQFSAGNAPNYLYTFDCLIGKNFPIPVISLKVVFVAITPIIAMIALIFFWSIKYIKYKIKKSDIRSKFITSEIVVLTILQPTVVNTMTMLFSCKTIDGIKRLTNDLYYECYNDENNFYSFIFAFPSLIVWIVLYPLFNLYRLFKSKKNLNKIKIRKKYGFLYNSYKLHLYYWEVFETYKKYLMIVIINFLQNSFETKSLILIMISGFSAYNFIMKKPYLSDSLNKTAFLAEIVALTTIFFGLLSYSIKDDLMFYVGTIAILGMNVTFLLYFSFRMAVVYRRKIIQILNESPFFKKNCIKVFYKFKTSLKKSTIMFNPKLKEKPLPERNSKILFVKV